MRHVKGESLFSECKPRDWNNSLANGFFQSPFEVNEMLCLLNRFALFTNQKQLLKCVRQNSYQGLWSYTSYIIRKGVLLLVKLQTGGINKLLKWNISQAFLKVLTSAQELHCRTTVFEERLPMFFSALKHDHEIILIKSAESSKLWRSSRK